MKPLGGSLVLPSLALLPPLLGSGTSCAEVLVPLLSESLVGAPVVPAPSRAMELLLEGSQATNIPTAGSTQSDRHRVDEARISP
jgi:hypothetical protein